MIRNSGLYGIAFSSGFILPVPKSISYLWNLGSRLLVVWIIQVVSGILLTSLYDSSFVGSFSSVDLIIREVFRGVRLRLVHVVRSNIFMFLLISHVRRGLYYGRCHKTSLWISGTFLLILFILVCFLRYVLPIGQMSIWGATVITNLVTVLPYGYTLVVGIWGGFSIDTPMVRRCLVLHFLLPILRFCVIFIHLVLLHTPGSGSVCGSWNMEFNSFFPFYLVKDRVTISRILLLICCRINQCFLLRIDSDNWLKANPIVTPAHIKPEWYFLCAYAILRNLDIKSVGVLGLLCSILVILVPCIKYVYVMSNQMVPLFSPLRVGNFCVAVSSWIVLTIIGGLSITEVSTSFGKYWIAFYFGCLSLI